MHPKDPTGAVGLRFTVPARTAWISVRQHCVSLAPLSLHSYREPWL